MVPMAGMYYEKEMILKQIIISKKHNSKHEDCFCSNVVSVLGCMNY